MYAHDFEEVVYVCQDCGTVWTGGQYPVGLTPASAREPEECSFCLAMVAGLIDPSPEYEEAIEALATVFEREVES